MFGNIDIKVLYFSSEYTSLVNLNNYERSEKCIGILPSANLVICPGFYSLWDSGGGDLFE